MQRGAVQHGGGTGARTPDPAPGGPRAGFRNASRLPIRATSPHFLLVHVCKLRWLCPDDLYGCGSGLGSALCIAEPGQVERQILGRGAAEATDELLVARVERVRVLDVMGRGREPLVRRVADDEMGNVPAGRKAAIGRCRVVQSSASAGASGASIRLRVVCSQSGMRSKSFFPMRSTTG